MHTEPPWDDPTTETFTISRLLSSPEMEEGEVLLKQLRERTVLKHLAQAPNPPPLSLPEQIREQGQRFERLAQTAYMVLAQAANSQAWRVLATAGEVATAWHRAHDWATADPERFTPLATRLLEVFETEISPHIHSRGYGE